MQVYARVAKLVDAADLKSRAPQCAHGRTVVQGGLSESDSNKLGALVRADALLSCADVHQSWHQPGTKSARTIAFTAPLHVAIERFRAEGAQ